MDFSSVYSEVFKMAGWLFAAALVAGLLKAPWFKGMVGEAWVKCGAWTRLPNDTYHRIQNVTLPTPDRTMQIDHVFVSRCRISPIAAK